MTSGIGIGRANERWIRENWKPINTLGYRDYEPEITPGKGNIIFVGDSLAAGHGVPFDETYYFVTRKALSGRYNMHNVALPGASTRSETKNYLEFIDRYNVKPSIVVHQYFGNDMDDIYPSIAIEWRAPRWLRMLGQWSDVFSLVETVLTNWFNSSLGYLGSVRRAYEDPAIWSLHEKDLSAYLALLHGSQAKIIFLVFPFLGSAQADTLNAIYISKLKAFFGAHCNAGDVFIDVSPIANDLPPGHRTAGMLDAHPSSRLHDAVGKLISKIIAANGHALSDHRVIACRQ
jgi:hypothetical protein